MRIDYDHLPNSRDYSFNNNNDYLPNSRDYFFNNNKKDIVVPIS